MTLLSTGEEEKILFVDDAEASGDKASADFRFGKCAGIGRGFHEVDGLTGALFAVMPGESSETGACLSSPTDDELAGAWLAGRRIPHFERSGCWICRGAGGVSIGAHGQADCGIVLVADGEEDG